MSGLGSQLLGSSPAGAGSGASVPMLPSTSPGARYIGTDGKPVIDAENGGFMKADPVAMRVYFALKTTLKSAAANEGLGVEWPRKIDSRFESYLTNAINVALADLVKSKTIKIERVLVQYPQPERYYALVEYRNLVTQKRQQIAV